MEIVIKEISNFPHGKVEVKDNGFIVDTSVSKVLVHIQERVDTIFFKKSLEKTWEEISVLHCRDLENHKISLIGCKMKIKGLDSFVILWQTVLYGDYKDTDEGLLVKKAVYTIESPYVGKNLSFYLPEVDYQIDEECNIYVSIKKKWENNRYVMQISFLPEEHMEVSSFYTVYMRLMEIYYLYLEFFPAIMEPRYTIDDGTELLIFHRFSRIYSSSANIAKYSYSIKIADNIHMDEFYKKWKMIRNKEKAVFNLFCFTARCEDYILETPTATIIQCMEGYFRCHHGDALEKYGSDITRQLIDSVKNSLNNSNEWIDLCNENGIESPNIISRIEGLLGQLNSCSLRDILIMGMEYNQYTKMLFEYEHTHETENKVSYFSIFLKKATGHRNWLSHMMTPERCFEGDENTFARDKLSVLFRLILMQDIELPVDLDSLNKIINTINKWYDNHQLNNRKKIKK